MSSRDIDRNFALIKVSNIQYVSAQYPLRVTILSWWGSLFVSMIPRVFFDWSLALLVGSSKPGAG